MSFNIIHGHFAPPYLEQKASFALEKLNKHIQKKSKQITLSEQLRISPLNLARQEKLSKEPFFLEKCSEAIEKKDAKILPETLKTYYCPSVSHPNSIFRDILSKNKLQNLHTIKKRFFNTYIQLLNETFNKIPNFEEEGNPNNKCLSIDDYKFQCKKAKESIMKLNDEKIKNEIKKLYSSFDSTMTNSNDLLTKDVRLFKLLLAKTIVQGLQNRDYSYFTVTINDDLIKKIISNLPNKNKITSLENTYKKAVIEYQQEHFAQWGIKEKQEGNETLIRIPKTQPNEKYYIERYQVLQTYSCKTWCTHTYNAPKYLQQGDFVIYKPDKNSCNNNHKNVAFRYENDKIVEIENFTNDRNINPWDLDYYNTIFNKYPELKKHLSNFLKNKITESESKKNRFKNILELYNTNIKTDLTTEDVIAINKTIKKTNETLMLNLNKLNSSHLSKIYNELNTIFKTTKDVLYEDDTKMTQINNLLSILKQNNDSEIQEKIKEIESVINDLKKTNRMKPDFILAHLDNIPILDILDFDIDDHPLPLPEILLEVI